MSFFFNKVTSYFTLFSVKGNICSLGADAKFWQCIPLADFMPEPVEQVTKNRASPLLKVWIHYCIPPL